MNKVLMIGIAGGSGSGKSTVAIRLCKKYPEKVAVVHVDDYFKRKQEVPLLEGFTNWDHPDAVNFERIFKDLILLKNGQSVTILTKSELYNPDYRQSLNNKIEYCIEPKPIIILEGYLALWDKEVRDLLDHKVYLDIPIEESVMRRSANKFLLDQEYFLKVLLPMHRAYVEQTKKYADMVIDVTHKDADEVFRILDETMLRWWGSEVCKNDEEVF